jgi:hypothetical protein
MRGCVALIQSSFPLFGHHETSAPRLLYFQILDLAAIAASNWPTQPRAAVLQGKYSEGGGGLFLGYVSSKRLNSTNFDTLVTGSLTTTDA